MSQGKNDAMKAVSAFAAFLMLWPWILVQRVSAQSCPPHEHVTGTALKGNVQCTCDDGYVFDNGQCSARVACVMDAGYQLKFALADCDAGTPSRAALSCYAGIGISEKALSCFTNFPKAGLNRITVLAMCGLIGVVPSDAAERCQGISNECITNALQAHKARITICEATPD